MESDTMSEEYLITEGTGTYRIAAEGPFLSLFYWRGDTQWTNSGAQIANIDLDNSKVVECLPMDIWTWYVLLKFIEQYRPKYFEKYKTFKLQELT